MIHYHGTPIGGSRQDTARFLMGRHALVSFYRPDDLGIVAEACQSFVFDNGAYSIWKDGGELDVEGYIAWTEEWYRHPSFDWALIPDEIGGTEDDNDALITAWPRHLPGVPIWHPDESIARFGRLCKEWPRVAIGASTAWPRVGSKGWWRRIGEAMDAVCDEEGRPPAKLHGLKMLNPEVFTRLPLASADSSTAGRRATMNAERFGMYLPPTSAQRAAVIAERIEQHNSAPRWVRVDQHDLFRQEATTEGLFSQPVKS